MIDETQSLLIVILAAAIAPIIAGIVSENIRAVILPVVVVELLLGVVIGPQVLELASDTELLGTFSDLGLGFLFFFAGYEIRFEKIKGNPLRLAVIGWLISLVLAYSAAGALHWAGVVISGLLTGSALVTTAIGTLIPIARDEHLLEGEFGRNLLSIGAIGEFGPVLIVTVLLGAKSGAAEQLVLIAAFTVIVLLTALISAGIASRWFKFINDRLEQSGQLPVRLTVLLVVALIVLAADLGLDIILGAFAAGMITAMVIGDRGAKTFESKLEAVGFGFLIPFFFVMSGVNLDVASLFSGADGIVKLAIFFVLMFVVRGVPVLFMYRGVVEPRERMPLALMASTQLPLVVAITSIGLDTGEMVPTTAAALVSAAVLTVLVFPSLAIALLRRGESPAADPA